MSGSNSQDVDRFESEQTEQPDVEAPPTGDTSPPEAAEAESAALDETETLRKQVAELEDKNLRLMAEIRNTRQRAERERSDALRYAEANLARDLLVIVDDLERTLQSADTATDVQAVASGVRIVYEHFLKVLADKQITPIEATGAPFDPGLHEALLQQPSDAHPAGTVIQELQRGYQMHDRVIRAARVIVSSGAPATPESEAGENEDA